MRAVAFRPTAWCSFNAFDGAPYLHVHRGDLPDVLMGTVGEINLDHRVVGVDQHRGRAMVSFAGGDTATADLVIGADGVRGQGVELRRRGTRAVVG